jgi:hypothetical protein
MNQWTWGPPNNIIGGLTGTWCFQILPFIEQNNLYNNWNYTTPIPTMMDPGRGGSGLSSIALNTTPDQTVQTAGPYCDYAANCMLIGSVMNTNGPVTAPQTNWSTFGNSPIGTGWFAYNRKLIQITDGTSNTIMIGSRTVNTNIYSTRGCYNFVPSTGTGTQPCADSAIAASGGPNEGASGTNVGQYVGVIRAIGPCELYWLANGATSSTNVIVPGCPYPAWSWATSYFGAILQDQKDVTITGQWGAPYASCPIGMADASVQLFNYSTTAAIMLAFNTPNGGEVVSVPE